MRPKQSGRKRRKRPPPTELFHALLVRFVQVEVALFHGPVDLETQAQTGVLHQLRVDVMDQGLEGQVGQEGQVRQVGQSGETQMDVKKQNKVQLHL